jgi:hypothetical protein
MKFSHLALAFLPSAAAFSPSLNQNRKITNVVKAEVNTMVSNTDVQRPLFDPLELYLEDSSE